MFTTPIFFDGWDSVGAVLVSVPFVYGVIILAVRVSGNRSLSRMNNFDWVVAVAMGAIVASAVILPVVTILDAAAALGGVLVLRWAATFATSRWSGVERAIKARPTLLVANSRFLGDAMRAHRPSEADIRSVLREGGYALLSQVRRVVLEADARISIIPATPGAVGDDAMADVPR